MDCSKKIFVSILILPSRKLTYPPKNGILKMIFFFPRWDMLIPWRVIISFFCLFAPLLFFRYLFVKASLSNCAFAQVDPPGRSVQSPQQNVDICETTRWDQQYACLKDGCVEIFESWGVAVHGTWFRSVVWIARKRCKSQL